MATINDVLDQAWRSFRAGDHQQAGQIALTILQTDPQQASALSLLGAIHLVQGQLAASEHYYRQVLAQQPNDVSSQNSLGVALARQGKLAEAVPHFREVLRLNPNSAEAHNNLALILKDQGQPAEAEQLFRQALQLSPNFAAAYNNLGLALREQGQFDEALAAVRRSIELDFNSPEAHYNLGSILRLQAKFLEAEAALRQAIALRPHYAEAYSALGSVLLEQGRLDEAETNCRQAVTLNPNSGQGYQNLALVLAEQGKHAEAHASLQRAEALTAMRADELLRSARAFQESRQFEPAVSSLRQALRLQPDSSTLHTALAGILQESGKPDQAEMEFREALRLEPSASAHDNLGTALARQGQNSAAREQFLHALTLRPDSLNAMINAGNTYASEGLLADADRYFSQALQLEPKSAEAHYSRAMVRLLQGDFERGWPEYEWRWLARGVRRIRPNFSQPLWDGSDLAGRTILLHTEGGLGDTLQFIRYAPLIKQRGGTVLLDSHPALVELLSRCQGIDRIIPRGAPLPDFDVYAPLMSLPFIFGTRIDTIPAAVPYVSIASELVDRWRRELAELPGLKIGVAWQGSPVHYHDRVRSFPLACLEPLARLAGVHLVCLQKHAGREQIPDFAARFPITDLGDRLDEATGAYLDTPAAMLSLDLVITPDSSLANASGALGVPVWLALPHVPEFRWLLDREDSPWYPSMRLFRQTSPGDWTGVFQRMATELTARLSRGS